MRFEIEVELASKLYRYAVAFEFPEGFKELRVREEQLMVNGKPVYTRDLAQVYLAKIGQDKEAQFRIDWHLVALPIVQEQSKNGPLFIFKQLLAPILILRPVPTLISENSQQTATLPPNPQVTHPS